MIEIYTLDPDDPGGKGVKWTGEHNEAPDYIFIYSNFVEAVWGTNHTLIPLERIDFVSWNDMDIAKRRAKIMEPVRHKRQL